MQHATIFFCEFQINGQAHVRYKQVHSVFNKVQRKYHCTRSDVAQTLLPTTFFCCAAYTLTDLLALSNEQVHNYKVLFKPNLVGICGRGYNQGRLSLGNLLRNLQRTQEAASCAKLSNAPVADPVDLTSFKIHTQPCSQCGCTFKAALHPMSCLPWSCGSMSRWQCPNHRNHRSPGYDLHGKSDDRWRVTSQLVFEQVSRFHEILHILPTSNSYMQTCVQLLCMYTKALGGCGAMTGLSNPRIKLLLCEYMSFGFEL